MSPIEKYEELVGKLLAKADRAGTPEEAETFYAKAQELISKHHIDEMKARGTREVKKEEYFTQKVRIASTYHQADVQLMLQIAKANDCRCFTTQGHGSERWISVFGFKSDVQDAVYLYNSLLLQSARLAKLARQPDFDYSSAHVFKRSFRLGFAATIGERLKASKVQVEQDAVKEDTSMSLVIVNKEKSVAEEFSRQNPGLRSSRRTRLNYSGAGSDAGRKAGHGVNVGGTSLSGGGKALGR